MYAGIKARPVSEWIAIDLEPIVAAEMIEAGTCGYATQSRDGPPGYEARVRAPGGSSSVRAAATRIIGYAKGKGVRTCYKCNKRYYLQRHLPLDERCPNAGQFSCEEIDELAWQAVLRVVSDDQLIVDTLQGSAVSATDAKEDQEIREREKEAKELMHRLENLYDFAETGDISREVYRKRKADIDARLAATQDVLRKIADRKAEQQRALENLAGVIELCEQVRKRLPLIPEEERRAFDLAIGLRVLVGPTPCEGRAGSAPRK